MDHIEVSFAIGRIKKKYGIDSERNELKEVLSYVWLQKEF